MLGHWETLLESVTRSPDAKLSSFKMLTAAEERLLLFDWNETARPYPKEKTLGQLFLEQAQRTPEAEALVAGTVRLTYRELASRAIAVARKLRKAGVVNETLVGICVERSWEMVAGILGTLLAGGAYVPIDPAYPKDRIAFMLADARVRVLLTQRKLRAELPATESAILCAEDIN